MQKDSKPFSPEETLRVSRLSSVKNNLRLKTRNTAGNSKLEKNKKSLKINVKEETLDDH